jgi:Ni/Co efflux regulator RcnB
MRSVIIVSIVMALALGAAPVPAQAQDKDAAKQARQQLQQDRRDAKSEGVKPDPDFTKQRKDAIKDLRKEP